MNDSCHVCGKPLSVWNGSRCLGYSLCGACLDEANHLAAGGASTPPRADLEAAIRKLQSAPEADVGALRLKCHYCGRLLEVPPGHRRDKIECSNCGVKNMLPASVRKSLRSHRRSEAAGAAVQSTQRSPTPVVSGTGAAVSAQGVRFLCPVCRRDVIVWHHSLGDIADCPLCAAPVSIPNDAVVLQHELRSEAQPTVAQSGSPLDSVSSSSRAHPSCGSDVVRNWQALVGMILGLLSYALFFIGLLPILALAFSGVGLARAMRTGGRGKIQSWIGLVSGAIGLVMYLVRYGHL